jgi:hypothetical protein
MIINVDWKCEPDGDIGYSQNGTANNYTTTNWRVSLSKICHEWPNNTVTHECAQRMSELQRYLVMCDIFLIMQLVN